MAFTPTTAAPDYRRPRAMDLFCGGGGASIGLERAGFDVVAAVDKDETACSHYEQYLGLEPLEADIRELSYDDILAHFNLGRGDIDAIVGCPPCQNFSTLRSTTPWPEDKSKDELLKTFIKIIRDARPRMVLFENVPGILTADGDGYFDIFLEAMDDIGYGVAWDKVNAADYGVPQKRKRVIAAGVLGVDDEELSFPERTHAPSEEAGEEMSEWVSVADAIWDLPKLQAGESSKIDGHEASNHQEQTIEIFRAVPKNGGSRKDIEDEDLILDCHDKIGNSAGNVYGRMSLEEPGPTLTTRCTTPSCGRFIHPVQDRGITLREAARIMTFPDDYALPEYKSEAEALIGNAVPPKLIHNITENLYNKNQ